jgi:MerR family transcriptional regulator, copper efflux regulator
MLNLRVHSKVKANPGELRIGELAARSGLAATALRYHEQAGLLPAPRRTPAGYRVYDAGALPRLAFIRAAQAVGLTVAEIREVIGIRDGGRAPCAHVLALLERRRAEVQARIRELQQLERELTLLAQHGATVDPARCDPAGICEIIPAEAGPVSVRPVRTHRR